MVGISTIWGGFSKHLGVLIHLAVVEFLEKHLSACSCMRRILEKERESIRWVVVYVCGGTCI